MNKAIQIDGKDNVATVTSDVQKGEPVDVLSPGGDVIGTFQVPVSIPFGHKLALSDLKRGEQVVKYGETIGVASKVIKTGEWVHTHNVESAAVPTSGYRG
jgi:altronate dehydratase